MYLGIIQLNNIIIVLSLRISTYLHKLTKKYKQTSAQVELNI